VDTLKRLPLHSLHEAMGAKLGPFAGYLMPVQYAQGVITEHLHTRSKASLFDVSHMGQILLPPHADTALETLSPCDIEGLPENHQRYGLFTNDQGGVLDDFMLVRRSSDLFLVVNASRKAKDLNLLQAVVDDVEAISDRILLALQGPLAEEALARLVPEVATMRFLTAIEAEWENSNLWITRSGYTGEDGFEISAPISHGEALFNALLAIEEVEPAGLGARDTLRMEAGLTWAIGKARRVGGAREGGFPGDRHIFETIKNRPARRRVGLRPETKAPMRAGVPIFDKSQGGTSVGTVTSGGYSPSLGCPIAIGLIDACVQEDTQLFGEVRGSRLPATQTKLPFLPTRYRR
jgi:aminomethyltransferase